MDTERRFPVRPMRAVRSATNVWRCWSKEKKKFSYVRGYKEKLSSFQARRAKEGAGVNKRDVQKYLKKQQKEAAEPVNNAFAQALAGIKLD